MGERSSGRKAAGINAAAPPRRFARVDDEEREVGCEAYLMCVDGSRPLVKEKSDNRRHKGASLKRTKGLLSRCRSTWPHRLPG